MAISHDPQLFGMWLGFTGYISHQRQGRLERSQGSLNLSREAYEQEPLKLGCEEAKRTKFFVFLGHVWCSQGRPGPSVQSQSKEAVIANTTVQGQGTTVRLDSRWLDQFFPSSMNGTFF